MAESLNLLPELNATEEVEYIVAFIKKSFAERGFSRAVIAVSGGIDSACSLSLTTKALGDDHIFPLLLPYGDLNRQGTADALTAVAAAGINQAQTEILDIVSVVDPYLRILDLEQKRESDKIRIGNVMARCRMIALYDRAKKHKALVVGTENRSEDLLSYFTRFGDEASDIEPIKHLYKTQVYQLAKHLGLPDTILTKAPTAGLWIGQTDETEFGFTYELADQTLYGLYDLKLSEPQLVEKGAKLVDIQRVKKWVETHHFKHELPIICDKSLRA